MTEAATPSPQHLHELYRDHRGWLETWLRRRMGNAWDAADLSQDTFLRVLCSAQPIADMREPRAYLLTVGKRLSKDFYVAYETGLAGAVGTLQVFYDLSRRISLRASTGTQSAIDLVFTQRYD